ncbi:MAG: 5'/3'-nucleotidase SurE [Chloroflexi bacterium]|nr:5'/3'-nucleotidase SurE [Chloroflexota bacterium]
MTPLILITNDDGIHSPGLHAAINALHDLGDLLVIAPTRQQSGKSCSFDADFDGAIQPIQLALPGGAMAAYHMDGTPAQSVLYGVVTMADRLPDMVVSGINFGENLGSNTLVSGTVGAALQGGDMGIPSLALSLEVPKDYHYNHGHDVDWSAAEYWLRQFARQALEPSDWPPDVSVLKIDIPDTATPATSWRITRQSRQSYYRSVPAAPSSASGPRPLDYEVVIDYDGLEPDSDIYAFAIDRVISVTPLSTDLTARVALPHFDSALRYSLARWLAHG